MANEDFPLTEEQQSVIQNYGNTTPEPIPTLGQGTVSFSPEQELQQNKVSFTQDGANPLISPPLAAKRADKVAYATGVDREKVYQTISSGREDLAREKVTLDGDIEFQKRKQLIIQNYAKSVRAGGREVTPEEISTLEQMTAAEYAGDPKTIFEKKFAEKFFKDTAVKSAVDQPLGPWGKAFKANPIEAAQNMKIFSEIATKSQIADTIADDIHEEAKQNSWTGATWNFVKSVTPFLSWYNQSRILKEASWSGLSLPGQIKRDQLNYLLSLPNEQFEPEARKAIAQLKAINFNDAREFAEALKGYSTSDQFLMSSTGVLDLSLLPIGRAAKAATSVGKRALGLGAKATDEAVEVTGKFAGAKATPENVVRSDFDLNSLPPINEVVQDVLFTKQGSLFDNLPEMTKPGLGPGKLRATYKPIAQQEAEAEARSKMTGLEYPNYRNNRSQMATGQGRYEQLDFQDLDKPRGFDKVQFKREGGYDQFTGLASQKMSIRNANDWSLQMAYIGTTRAADAVSTSKATAAALSGDSELAALYGSMERRTADWDTAPMKPTDFVLSSHNPGNPYGQGMSLAAARANELSRVYEAVLDNTQRVNRIPEVIESGIAFRETASKLLRNYGPKYADGILDVVHLPSSLFKSNVGQAVLRLGDNQTKTPFKSAESAEYFAQNIYKLTPDEYKIYVAPGGEHYIGVRANIAENTDRVADAVATLRKPKETNLFTLLNKFRMTDAYIPAESMAQRKVAEHAQQNLKNVIRDTADFFLKIGRDASKEVEKVLDDYAVKREWFNSPEDFKKAFQYRHRKAPTDDQVEAAYLYQRMQGSDLMNRNMGVFRDMARQGVERYALYTGGTPSEFFHAIEHQKLPWGIGDDFTIAKYGAGDKEPTVVYAHQADRAEGRITKKELDKLVDDGWHVLQVFDSDKPLSRIFKTSDSAQTPINFIITDAIDRKPLSWIQVKNDPGPHSIYKHDWFIKQPKINVGHLGRDYYYGDNTLWNFSSRAEAEENLKHLETARKMVQANDPAAEAYIAANTPFGTKNEFLKLKSQFDFEHPFSVTQSGHSVFETTEELNKAYPHGVINFHKSVHNPQNFMDRTFLQERDALLMNPVERNGVMRFEQSKQLDPYMALERGLSQSIRNIWLNDEKVRSVTKWIEDYRDVIDVNNKDMLRKAPMWALYNSKLLSAAPGAKLYEKVVAAEQERQAIINFVGQQTEWGNAVGRLRAATMDTIYGKLGHDAADFANEHSLNFLKDPARYFRTAAAHMKIGMFNPIPMLQQGMIMFNINAIAPEHTVRAAAATWLMHTTGYTAEEAILNKAAKMAESFGWKAKDFREMNLAYRESGLNFVGSEASLRQDNFDAHLFRSGQRVLADKGFMFFNAGDRFGRKAAFSTAYAEWRAENPLAKLTPEIKASILQRADTLTGHMTAASLANYQKGAISIPLQFTTYYTNMAQMMMGKELTMAEKARLIGVNAMLFGVPAGIGIGGLPGAAGALASSVAKDRNVLETGLATASGAMGLWPVYDDIMEYAKAKNIDMSPMYVQALMKGIPNLMFQMITGKDPDFAKNYALGSNGFVRDILRQDKGFFEVLGGVSGSVLGDIVEGSYPLLRKLYGTFMDDPNSEFGPIQSTDWERLARNIGTLDLTARVWAAVAYGKHITKKGVEIGGLDAMDAFLTAARLNPKQVQEAYLTMNVNQDQKIQQQKYEKLALESMRRGNSFLAEGDTAKYLEYLKDARMYMKAGDFGFADQNRIFHRAVQESKGFEENVQRAFQKRAPESQQINRILPQHFRTNP